MKALKFYKLVAYMLPSCLVFFQRHEKNPIWNELFELEFDDVEEGKVVIVLYNEAAPPEFQVLGYCQFYLQALEEGRVTERWLKVYKDAECMGSLQESKYRGKINVELVHRCYDVEELQGFRGISANFLARMDLGGWHRRRSTCLSDRFSRKGVMWELIRGVLSITVLKAENLMPSDYQGLSDPYVVLRMLKQKRSRKKTSVLHNTLNPIWDETFHFLVEDARQDMLHLQVWNDDTFGRDYLGSTATTLTRVIQESAFEAMFRLVGVPCGKVSLRLEWKTSATDPSIILQRPILSPSDDIPSSHSFLHMLTEFPHRFE
ncbi:hypothetical protein KC19_1G258300 [Ceratodon purpureus]|uniref:C2 domain-containing protein n=1 Tax=Ceratodon purpureus TaxID=3225 RepID=A0A8T0JCS2_CERPU|nr:hypothetical protein KC19_1G258300 [Ceratodon purpureus]